MQETVHGGNMGLVRLETVAVSIIQGIILSSSGRLNHTLAGYPKHLLQLGCFV